MNENQGQEPIVTLTVRASWLNVIMGGLDELPHKFSRPVFDELSKQINEQMNQQLPKVPQGPLSNKVIS